jgi:hypothetical protein
MNFFYLVVQFGKFKFLGRIFSILVWLCFPYETAFGKAITSSLLKAKYLVSERVS